MKSRLPWISSVLLLAAAVLAALGGLHLARRDVVVRKASDRAILGTLAAKLQREIQRLDAVFDADVRLVASRADLAREFDLRADAGNFHGIVEATLLTDAAGSRPRRVRIEPAAKGLLPEVRWSDGNSPAWGELDPGDVLGYEPGRNGIDPPPFLSADAGWIQEEKRPWAFFWERRIVGNGRAEVLVLTIDVSVVQGVLRSHLQQWLAREFAPVAALKGFDFVQGPDGAVLAGARSIPTESTPDFIAPTPGRWGDWQVASWDRLETKVEWQPDALTATATISSVLALTGLLVFVQLRRAWRLAEERVSFVNRVSHELGSPLTNMLLNLDLAREAVEVDPAAAAARLDVLSEEGQRLARLVENVLVFSRQSRGAQKFRLVPCQPDSVVAAVLRQFEPALRRRNVVISRQGCADERVMLDPDALAQILANLVSNVEKYAAGGGVLDLTSSWCHGRLVLDIRDAGPGIPAEKMEEIFRPFARLHDAVNEGASGTGLGLSIARELARQMGGDLQCLPAESGAHFRLELPAPAAAAATEPTLIPMPKSA